MKWQWLTRAHLLSCLFLEHIGSTSMFTIWGSHLVIQSRMSRTSFPCSPACDLRTLGSTYITPQSSLHSVPFTDISLFRDGNNPDKTFCTALLSFSPAYLGYDRYMHNHICVLACNDPVYFTEAGRIKQRILCCRKYIIILGSSDLFIEQ